jgi:predicted HTH domain antitoxin
MEERKKWVMDLYFNQHKTYVEIAKIARMSIRDISDILKEEESKQQNYNGQHQQEDSLFCYFCGIFPIDNKLQVEIRRAIIIL